MTELALMVLAANLISNPTTQVESQYVNLSQQDQAKVEYYIQNQNQLPPAIENMIQFSKDSGDGGSVDSPTRETSSGE